MYPTLFKIGPIALPSYGVVVAIAFAVTFLLLNREARRQNFHPDKILDLEFFILIFGIIGARVLHILVNFDFYFYRKNLIDIFLIWRGGLAFYGGLISAILASWVFIVKNKLPLWKTADFIAPYIALGQSMGRIGCFLNGCCFGKPTKPPFLGVIFPGDSIYRHPTQFYATLALLCIFITLRLAQKKRSFNGFVFGLYLILYSFQRFFIDFLRGDTPGYVSDLTVSQIISVIVFVVTILFVFFARRKHNLSPNT